MMYCNYNRRMIRILKLCVIWRNYCDCSICNHIVACEIIMARRFHVFYFQHPTSTRYVQRLLTLFEKWEISLREKTHRGSTWSQSSIKKLKRFQSSVTWKRYIAWTHGFYLDLQIRTRWHRAVEFALNALNEINSNTNFFPRTTVFFLKNAVTSSCVTAFLPHFAVFFTRIYRI